MLARYISEVLIKRYAVARSVYVFGPRQSGKTTLVKNCFPNLPYTNLENPDTLDYAVSDPRSFLAGFPDGAIIDEPQRYPDLFSYLEEEIDNKKKYVLTSSQNFLTMESVTQSLAGRISLLTLLPLSLGEIQENPYISLVDGINANKQQPAIGELWPYILKGGYPELYATPASFDYWHADYIRTYVERDVRKIINVSDLSVFQRFIKLCAGRSGSVLNLSSLANDTGVSETTCKRWLSLLEQSGIIFLLKPYFKNFNKRLIKSKKIVFLDSGLCCYLLNIRTVDNLKNHPLVGSIVETFVISEIYKKFTSLGIEPDLYYWRDQHHNEIDLIVNLPDSTILPIEIKSGQTINSSMYKYLANWCELSQVPQGVVIYGGKDTQSRGSIKVCPLGIFTAS